ncbi:hypothetical protein Scep_011832 [Stephania cephalantha]|uniref:Aminotransferase-like plant mobile domain-containing protein n=1 Tax=Stephania cephalantha TaxID=152367 RepID=A0AAP0JE48_9MAGN
MARSYVQCDLAKCCRDRVRLQSIIQASGLSALTKCTYKKTRKTLIAAFVERWQPETNTFHLPFGEMSITLEDVSMLLKIPVMGKVVDLSFDVQG